MKLNCLLVFIASVFVFGCSSTPKSSLNADGLRKRADELCKSSEKHQYENFSDCTKRLIYSLAKAECAIEEKQGGESTMSCTRRLTGK